jgi:hypothetical protein
LFLDSFPRFPYPVCDDRRSSDRFGI